jgi:hypothetical protein
MVYKTPRLTLHKTPRLRSFIAASALLAASGASAGEAAAWNGVWMQIWGEFTPMKVVVRDGRVVEYRYKGAPQPVADLRILENSPAKLSFGAPPEILVMLNRTGPDEADGRFHGPQGEAHAAMKREAP